MSGPVELSDLPDTDRPASPEPAGVLIDAVYDDRTAATERFGQVQSRLPRIETSRPMWRPPAS